MKKIRKIIIPIGMLIIFAMAINILFQPVQQIKTANKQLKAYNHEAENMLDNVFKIDNQIILPFIFKTTDDRVTVTEVTKAFKAKDLTIKNITTTSIGTGTQITVEETEDVYNVVIYGDITGDGIIGLIDAQQIILNYIDSQKYPIEGLKAIAANVSNVTSAINLPDAQRLIMFYLNQLETSLVVNEPEEDPIIPNTPTEPSTPSTPSTPSKPKDYVKRIEVTAPTRTDYIVDENIDLEGGQVKVIYNSGNTKTQEITSTMITRVDTSTKGTKTIEVSYETDETSSGNTETFKGDFQIEVFEEDDTVNKIIIETEETTTFIVGEAIQVPIKFYHKYTDNLEKEIKEVAYKDVDVSLATNFEIKLFGTQGLELENSDAIVKQISIKAKNSGEKQVVPIKVGTYTEENNIKIDVLAPTLIIGDNSSINLYLSDPQLENTDNVDGTIYTILPISLNGKGINATEIDTTSGKIQIIDSEEADPMNEMPVIDIIKAYKKDENNNYVEVSTKNESAVADYIGIALFQDLTADDLKNINLKIIIDYYLRIETTENPVETKTLTVNVVE